MSFAYLRGYEFIDQNNDSISDITLRGITQNICEEETTPADGPVKEVKVASSEVNKVFLWDKDKKIFVEY